MENRYFFLRLRSIWFREKRNESLGSDGNASVVSDSSSGADLAD
jgi:hypothetical protein